MQPDCPHPAAKTVTGFEKQMRILLDPSFHKHVDVCSPKQNVTRGSVLVTRQQALIMTPLVGTYDLHQDMARRTNIGKQLQQLVSDRK